MKKQLLLAAAAVTALVAAGSAQAASVSYRAGVGGTLNDATAVPYTLARELNFTAGVTSTAGTFDTVIVANNAIPAGTYTIQFDFAGATINAQVPNATITAGAAATGADVTAEAGFVTHTGTGATLTLVSGGTVGSTSVTYTLQVPDGSTVTAVGIAPALRVVGAVSVTAAIRNQVGNAFYEPAVIQNLIYVSTNPAFATRVNGRITGADALTFGAGAGVDTRIDDGSAGNPFNTLVGGTDPVVGPPAVVGNYQVGQVDVAVAGSVQYNTILSLAAASIPVKRDLSDNNVVLTDVTGTAINIQGNLAGLTFRGSNGTAALTPATAANASTVTLSGAPDANGTYTVNVTPTSVAATAAQLNPTELPVSAQLTLNSIFAAQPAFTGNFESLQTDGLSYVIPWVTSNAFGQITGSTSVIRVSNIGTDFANAGGRVYGQLYNPTNIAGVATTSRSFNFGTLGGQVGPQVTFAAGPPIVPGFSGIPSTTQPSEIVIGSVELQNAFGDFGRGDLRLTITDTSDNGTDNGNTTVNPQSIVVKRVIRSANGSLTEMDVVAGGPGVAPHDQIAGPY